MRICMIYFTGTYNTRFITQMLSEKMQARSISVDCVEINCDTPAVSTEGYDYVGLGYPIYAFNSPLPFNRFLSKCEFSKGQQYFIYKNSGETLALNNSSSRIVKRRMKKVGAVLTGEYHFIMPYNIHFAFEKDFVRELLDKNNRLAEVLLDDMTHHRQRLIKSNFGYDLLSAVISVQKVGAPINSMFYRVDKKCCIGCNLCVNSCPEKNIRVVKGKIKFGRRCAMCMRCSFFCPKDAVRIGLLEGWKVNGDYDLKSLSQQGLPARPYITPQSKGFYKCFIKSYRKIDQMYDEMLNRNS